MRNFFDHNLSSYIDPKVLLLAKNLQEQNYLSSRLNKLNQLYKHPVTFGSEIEFYLTENIPIEKLSKILPSYNFQKERGNYQFEYHVGPFEDPHLLIGEIIKTISTIKNIAENLGGKANFDPKPFSDDFGNSLQIQFSSICHKFQDDIDRICASFCKYSLETFLAYAPSSSDYQRFDKNFMAPTHVGYGYNNRTCLIRIKDSQPKRIEIRSPSPICNLYLVFCTVLQQNVLAYKETDINENTIKRIYGIASDEQYKLLKLPKDIKEARKYFNEEFYQII